MGAADAYTEGLDSEGWLRRLYAETRQKSAGQGIDLPEYDAFQEAGLVARAILARHVGELRRRGLTCHAPRTLKELLDSGLAEGAIPLLVPVVRENDLDVMVS